ncbi:HTH domain-containing protein [Patescibacteria group bacterium]
MNKNPSLQYGKLVSRIINNISSQRTREIIDARFGLLDGKKRTLEFIGERYDITRERVRQIVDSIFYDLKKSDEVNILNPAFQCIDNYFSQKGNVVREEQLLSDLTNTDDLHPERGAIFFLLALGKSYQRSVESNKFYPLWYNSKKAFKKAENVIDVIVKNLEEQKNTVSFDGILEYINNKKIKITEDVLSSYLDASKQIGANNSNQFGLNKWPEINPRGVKDKAYIIFKEQGKPLHFREVAELINNSNLGSILAQAQTVHNELIKDERFILVGRGTYALSEWGYQPGTVKEVIINILKNSGPLPKDEIIDEVFKSRLVKKNTVLINLQNRNYFARTQDNKYILK